MPVQLIQALQLLHRQGRFLGGGLRIPVPMEGGSEQLPEESRKSFPTAESEQNSSAGHPGQPLKPPAL